MVKKGKIRIVIIIKVMVKKDEVDKQTNKKNENLEKCLVY